MTQVKRSRLTPLGAALVLPRERIQEVLDDAVARGRMTRDDASELLAELVRRGTGPADRLIREVGRATASLRSSPLESVAASSRLVSQEPIAGYDDLTAAQVIEQLDGLTTAQLRTVRDHERRNANRKSVLEAIDRKLP